MAYDPIAALINWVAGLLQQLLTKLWEGIEWILQWVVEMLSDLMSVVWDMLKGIFGAIQEALVSFFATVETVLKEIVESVWEFLKGAWQALEDATIGVLDTISNFVSDLWAKLGVFIDEILDTVKGWVSTAVDWVKTVVEAGIQAVEAFAERAGNILVKFVQPLLDSVNKALREAMATISAAWEQLVIGARAIIEEVNQRLVGLKEAFKDAALEIVAKVGEVGDDMIAPLRDAITEFVEAYIPKDDPAAVQRATVALEGIHTDPGSMHKYRAWWAGEWKSLADAGPLRKTIFFGMIFLATILPTLMGISQTLTQITLQEYAKEFPYQILSPGDASAAYRRELITKGEAIEQIRKAGFSEQKAEDVVELTSTVPAQPDLIHMFWREIINDNMLDKALRQHGLDEPWRKHLKEAAKIIPPLPDLIHMGVRDVWNPAAVEAGKLFELFPEELGEWAEKQGLSQEWARKYWAAHWVLPSPLQGFEMLHRGEIGDTELDVLLQALDLAPGWREPLKAIAYHPFTRVDVRRMHRLGVLGEKEVTKAYTDLGYDETKALALTEFTLAINEPKGIEDDAELGALSRTAILGFYEDGLLVRDRANTLLISAGHTPEAASLYLDSVDSTEERKDRKIETDLVIELAEAGTLGWDEAQDKLRGLGLETKEVERAITRLLRAQQRMTKIPSKADADGLLTAGLINDGEYLDVLSRNGYAPRWAKLFLQKVRAKDA